MRIVSRNPVGRILGYGSAREGLGPWLRERVTAAALIPLGLWFVAAAVGLSGSGYDEVRAWLATPWNTTLLLLTVVLGFWHSKLGIQVIIEDYVHGELAKGAALLANLFAHALLATVSVVAALKVSLGS